MITGVYAILNVINGMVYIGSAVDIRFRWYRHIWTLRLNTHANPHLQAAWNRDGKEAFEFILLECIPKSKLIEREQYYIDKYNSFEKHIGYNIRRIAKSNLGLKATIKTIERMRIVQLKRWKRYRKLHPESVVIKICLCGSKITGEPAIVKKRKYCSVVCASANRIPWNKGKTNVYSVKTLEIMSKKKRGISINMGHKVSKETRAKISKANSGKKRSKAFILNLIKISTGRKHSNKSKKLMSKIRTQYYKDLKDKNKVC